MIMSNLLDRMTINPAIFDSNTIVRGRRLAVQHDRPPGER